MDIIKIVGDIIKELGFPIGMAIALFWMANTTIKDVAKQNAEAIGKLDATLDRQNVAIDKLNETINESDEKRFERITKMDAAVEQLITLSKEMKDRLEAIEKLRERPPQSGAKQAQRTPKKQAGARCEKSA